MPRTPLRGRLAASLLAGGLAVTALTTLSACGSTTGGPASSADQTASAVDQDPNAQLPPSGVPATTAPASAAPDTAAPSDTTSASASAGASDAKAASTTANTPAVANATDLTTAPVIAKGTGTASPSLVTRDLVVGKGTAATAADTVDVRYVGTVYTTGTVFDSSWTRTPTDTSFSLAQVVPGFAQGIVGMKPGGRREIVIPAALGYGPSGGQPDAGISATDTIVFVVDLLKASAS